MEPQNPTESTLPKNLLDHARKYVDKAVDYLNNHKKELSYLTGIATVVSTGMSIAMFSNPVLIITNASVAGLNLINTQRLNKEIKKSNYAQTNQQS